MRSTSFRSFTARSALLALGVMLGAAACSEPLPDIVDVSVGGADPCANGCEDTSFEASSAGSGFPMCFAASASQDCFDGDPCTNDLCLFGTCAHTPSNVCSGPGALVFAEGYGISDAPRAISVAAGTDGTTIVAALFIGDIAYGGITSKNEGPSLLIRDLDSQGKELWARVFSGAGGIDRIAVAGDSAGDVILTGSFLDDPSKGITFGGPSIGMLSSNETTFVVKLTASGEHVWSKAFPATGSSAGQSVAVDAKGTIAISGRMEGTINFGSGPLGGVSNNNTFIAALDPDGKPLWARSFGDDSSSVDPLGYRLAFAPSGDLVVAGSFSGKADVGNGSIGTDGTPGSFVTRLDPLGSTVWSDAFFAPGASLAVQGAAVSSEGAIFVSGAFSGSTDFGAGPLMTKGLDEHDLFVFALDDTGKTLWSRSFGDEADQTFCTVAVSPTANEPLIAGTFQGRLVLGTGQLETTSKLESDVFVGALDAEGTTLWGRRFGDHHDQGASALAVDAQGNLVVGGFLLGPLDFGAGPLALGQPGVGSFVAKLSP